MFSVHFEVFPVVPAPVVGPAFCTASPRTLWGFYSLCPFPMVTGIFSTILGHCRTCTGPLSLQQKYTGWHHRGGDENRKNLLFSMASLCHSVSHFSNNGLGRFSFTVTLCPCTPCSVIVRPLFPTWKVKIPKKCCWPTFLTSILCLLTSDITTRKRIPRSDVYRNRSYTPAGRILSGCATIKSLKLSFFRFFVF